jgi:far upstream element-binding protein
MCRADIVGADCFWGSRQFCFPYKLVHLLSVENIDENDLPLGRASQEILVIPSQTVGKVIGRSGEMIRELQSRSRAKIQIDHSGRSGLPPEQKQVTITGTGEAVAKAKEMVLFLVANPSMEAQQSLNMLIEDKLRTGMPWGSGPPYPNMPNQGINMTPNNASPHFQGTPGGYFGQPPSSYGGGMVQTPGYMGGGMPPQGPAPPMAYGGVVPTIPGGGQLPPAAYGAPSGYPMSYGGREAELVYVSKQYMGRIIGGKGVTISDLQQRSACDIQINQHVAPGQDCEITIKGTRQGIESAKQMIQEIIEIGPGHPYAGGSGAGMAAGGGAYGVPYQQGYDPGAGYGAPYGQQASYAPQYGQPQPDMGGGAGVSGAGYHGGGGYHGANAVPQQYGGFPPPPQQQAAPPPPAALSFWKAATAPDGQLYYYNERTGETQWDKPVGMP